MTISGKYQGYRFGTELSAEISNNENYDACITELRKIAYNSTIKEVEYLKISDRDVRLILEAREEELRKFEKCLNAPRRA